jgi:hypothetical protein
MDSISDSDSEDAGSIPAGATEKDWAAILSFFVKDASFWQDWRG